VINVKFRLSLNDGSFDKFKEMLLHFGIFKERKAASVTFNEEVELYLKCNNKLLDRGNDLAKRVNIVDYSDMLYLPQYFNLRPQRLFDVVFVDECQDLSLAQIKIALKYVKHEGRIIAVGDPYQSIYGFTGADIESFDRFKRLPEIQPLTLTRCFRCPANIIELAQKFRNDIYADDHRPGKVETIEFHEVIHTVKPNNLIISRTKAPLQKLLFELIENDIEVEVHEDEVKEFVNDLRFLFSKDELTNANLFISDPDLFDKVTERNVYVIEKKAKVISNIRDRESFIMEESTLVKLKVDFISRQINIHMNCKTLEDLMKLLERLISGGENAVKLSTIHRAKGLENDVIFILNYDKLPLSRDDQKNWEIIQERNLVYVALTRSKNTLYLVNSPKDELNTGSLYDYIGDLF